MKKVAKGKTAEKFAGMEGRGTVKGQRGTKRDQRGTVLQTSSAPCSRHITIGFFVVSCFFHQRVSHTDGEERNRYTLDAPIWCLLFAARCSSCRTVREDRCPERVSPSTPLEDAYSTLGDRLGPRGCGPPAYCLVVKASREILFFYFNFYLFFFYTGTGYSETNSGLLYWKLLEIYM